MFFYPKLFDVVCFSHTIDNVGNHFEFKILDLFARYWISMFSHSYNARLVWRERTGQSIRTFSETRWWSNGKFSGKCQSILVMSNLFFARTTKFLQQIADVFWRYLTILKAAKTYAWSWAALVDAGVHFVSATYYLEGDGPLIFTCL